MVATAEAMEVVLTEAVLTEVVVEALVVEEEEDLGAEAGNSVAVRGEI